MIKVKENAPELLRRALSRLPVDVFATGDYQAAEKKFEVSRRILEVCLDLGFPVSVLERSPLVLRDLDLLKEINQRAPSVVFFSMIWPPTRLRMSGSGRWRTWRRRWNSAMPPWSKSRRPAS